MEPIAGPPAASQLSLAVWLVIVLVPIGISALGTALSWLATRHQAYRSLQAAERQAIETTILQFRYSLAQRHATIFHERADRLLAVVTETPMNDEVAKEFWIGYPHVAITCDNAGDLRKEIRTADA